jgi:hypothetical protein
MPEICQFLGIIISMNYGDHNPPHFHVRYNEYEASIRIDNFGIIAGKLPPKIFGIVAEWAMMHQKELERCWELSKEGKIMKIEPLQ